MVSCVITVLVVKLQETALLPFLYPGPHFLYVRLVCDLARVSTTEIKSGIVEHFRLFFKQEWVDPLWFQAWYGQCHDRVAGKCFKFSVSAIVYTFWMKNPSKVIFLHTLNIKSCHAFLIAIQVRLLPKCLTTKQVCSKSTSKVFLRTPYLVPALALSFFMLHVAI